MGPASPRAGGLFSSAGVASPASWPGSISTGVASLPSDADGVASLGPPQSAMSVPVHAPIHGPDANMAQRPRGIAEPRRMAINQVLLELIGLHCPLLWRRV